MGRVNWMVRVTRPINSMLGCHLHVESCAPVQYMCAASLVRAPKRGRRHLHAGFRRSVLSCPRPSSGPRYLWRFSIRQKGILTRRYSGARDVFVPGAFRSRIRGGPSELVLCDIDSRRSVLDAPLPVFPIAIDDDPSNPRQSATGPLTFVVRPLNNKELRCHLNSLRYYF